MLEWDRGTVLLTDPPPDASSLPGVLWDPRISAWRAPAYRYAELAARIGGRLVDQTRIPQPAPTLRRYQENAVAAWDAAGHRGIVVLPTGAGKTRTAIAAIARTGLSTLCITPTRVLVNQWRQELARSGLAAGQLADGVYEPRRITVATTASARLAADRLGHRYALLVVDEVHHHATTDETLELYAAPCRLGLTATPPEDPVQLTRLAALVGPIVVQVTIDELAGDILAPYDLVQVPLDFDLETYRRAEPSRRWLVEVVGFWHPTYLADKLRRLAAARIEGLVLCIDEQLACGEEALPPNAGVLAFKRRIDPSRLLELVAATPPHVDDVVKTERLGVRSYFIDWAGRRPQGDRTHAALARLLPGTPLKLAVRDGYAFLVDADDQPVAALSTPQRDHFSARQSNIVDIVVREVLRWDRDRSGAAFRDRLRVDSWRLPLVDVRVRQA